MPRYTHLKPIAQRNLPKYEFRAFLDALGSDQEIHELIAESGYESPTVSVIRNWRSRNSIPTRWLPFLLRVAQNLPKPIPVDWIIREEEEALF